jgi:hypothetical protein
MAENLHDQYPEAFKDPKDDHLNMVVGARLKICQDTMQVPINKAQATADAAHRRLDDALYDKETGLLMRLSRLDDSKVGMVTDMWTNWNKFRNWVLIGFFTLMVAILAPWMVRPNNPSLKLGKEQLQEVAEQVTIAILKANQQNEHGEVQHGR